MDFVFGKSKRIKNFNINERFILKFFYKIKLKTYLINIFFLIYIIVKVKMQDLFLKNFYSYKLNSLKNSGV